MMSVFDDHTSQSNMVKAGNGEGGYEFCIFNYSYISTLYSSYFQIKFTAGFKYSKAFIDLQLFLFEN